MCHIIDNTEEENFAQSMKWFKLVRISQMDVNMCYTASNKYCYKGP